MDEFRALFDAFSSTINQFPVFVNVGNSHRLRILALLLRGSRLYNTVGQTVGSVIQEYINQHVDCLYISTFSIFTPQNAQIPFK